MAAIVKQNLYSVKIAAIRIRKGFKWQEHREKTKWSAPSRGRRKPARAAAERPAVRRRKSSGDTPYHHGDLREALLQAAERVLERDGLAGLTLRAVAREAGVSHAAPTHHFGDLTGLVSELAAIGFRMFNAAMVAAGNSETLPMMKGLASAKAYVAYAQAHPGMYGVMFRSARLDYSRPSLHEASDAAFAGLTRGVGASRHEQIPEDRCRWIRPPPSRAPGRWCMALPRCCSMAASPAFCSGCPRARPPTSCWTRCCAGPCPVPPGA